MGRISLPFHPHSVWYAPGPPHMTNQKPSANWLIYGANGYTGDLIATEAARRGLQPILAGRDEDAILRQAESLNLPRRVFDLSEGAPIRRAIKGCRVVLHCAGPFSATSRPMVDACLDMGIHYLDITGEIDVFAACHGRSEEARQRGVILAPGVGFDVVPTDSVAALLKESLPDAASLTLAFEAAGGPSIGTAKTGVEGLAKGGRVRRAGEVVAVPLAFKTRTFLRGDKPRLATTIPWGDVFTAYISTGIPDIEVYMATSPSSIALLRRLNWIRPFLRFSMVTRLLQARTAASTRAPSAERRGQTNCYIWGEAATRDGRMARMEVETPNGYDVTVASALGVVENLLERRTGPQAGYQTPSQLMGSGYALSLPGVVVKSGPTVA